MAGCNCKGGSVENNKEGVDVGFSKPKLINYLLKLMVFTLGIVILPFIMMMIIWFMFDTIVLNKDVDLKKITNKFIKTAKIFDENEEDEEDYEVEDLTEDDVVMLNVEDITNKNN